MATKTDRAMPDSPPESLNKDAEPLPPAIVACLTAALGDGALPGEADGFSDAARAEAGKFMARAALTRPADRVNVLLEPMPWDAGGVTPDAAGADQR